MTYPEVLIYLNSFADLEKNTNYSYQKDLTLARIKSLLVLLGNPQNALRIVHVAGTKGKGSTCAFAAYILSAAGYSVGLYTSPHLNDFRERIRILRLAKVLRRKKTTQFEGMISRPELSKLVKAIKPAVIKCNRYSKHGALTFFEVYTALAFLYFKRQQVDFVVLETGLGGRLDATNAACSLVCALTPISREHTQILGKSIAQIAVEKAGIIKRTKGVVISALQHPAAEKIIHQRCKKFQAKLYTVGKEIKYNFAPGALTVRGFKNIYKNLQIPLLGIHQRANAALAIGLIEGLSFYGYNFKAADICRGIRQTVWPGRCELAGKNPWLILDGAQNLASAQALKETISGNFKYQKLILVLGVSSDKDLRGICKTFKPLADEVILTRAATVRAAAPKKLAKYFKQKLYLTQSVKEAKLLAGRLAGPRDLILVTGSLFVVGEFKNV